MQQKVELFPKLIVLGVSVTAVIMIWMFVGPMLFKFLSQKLNSSTKKKSVDMDVLIRRKEQMLRGNSPTGQLIPTDKKKNERRGKISRAEQQYRDQFQKLSQNSKKSSDEKIQLQDIKNIMAVFDSLQWGEGKAFNSISSRFSKAFNYRVENSQIVKMIRMALKQNILLARKTDKLPSHPEMMELFMVLIIVDTLFWESRKQGGEFSKSLAKSFKVAAKDVLKGFESLLWKQKLSKEQSYKKLLTNNSTSTLVEVSEDSLPELYTKLSLSSGGKTFSSRQEFLGFLQLEANIFSTLSPLPPLEGKKDLRGAYLVFGLEADASSQEIKKRYKELVADRHPDKLSSRGIPSEFERVATENFHIIQQAYDILKKS